MSVQRATLMNAAIGVAVADKPEDLSAFVKPGCAAAIWRRRPLPEFQAWVDGLSADVLPHGRAILPSDAVAETIRTFCDMADTPRGPHRDRLVEDVSALAWIFAAVMQSPYVQLRLNPVTKDACGRFHLDAVTARLVCTYRGPGTQYGISTDGHDPRRVFSVPTGAPVLLRGTLWPDTLWPDQPSAGLLHRSPPIEDLGETRLVLTLDPVRDPEDEQ